MVPRNLRIDSDLHDYAASAGSSAVGALGVVDRRVSRRSSQSVSTFSPGRRCDRACVNPTLLAHPQDVAIAAPFDAHSLIDELGRSRVAARISSTARTPLSTAPFM